MLRKATASELADFIETARSIVGRGEEEPFSLEDLYFLADSLGLSGVVYLEKLEETRHVSVLLRLDPRDIVLYDPLHGLERRPRNSLHLGMYARPVGELRTEFDRFEETQRTAPVRHNEDPWLCFEERGLRLETFLEGNHALKAQHVLDAASFPPLQNRAGSRDCAPISLYALSLCRKERLPLAHPAPLAAEVDDPDCTDALEGPFPCSAT